jgi:imidazole glycerol-phosphate synthase subunit HisH
MITIVDYGMGNLGSVHNMFKRIGVPSLVTSDLNSIAKAEKILLPGVGAFDHAMQRIADTGMLEVLNQKALKEKIPVLGICLGMQLLTESSKEGVLPGLGWIPGHTLSFTEELNRKDLKVPHMGWNTVAMSSPSKLTEEFDHEYKFYFVHSYFVKCQKPEDVILHTSHGISFDSGIQRDNIFGVQFHPEKSHKYGMKVFKNFAKL